MAVEEGLDIKETAKRLSIPSGTLVGWVAKISKGANAPAPGEQIMQAGIAQHFPGHDGMYFLPNLAAEYYKSKFVYTASGQLYLTVREVATAIKWFHTLLKAKT